MNPDDVIGKDFGSGSDRQRKHLSLIEEASRKIMKKYHFLTMEETKEIWVYKAGVYTRGGELVIEKAVEKMFCYDIANRHLAEIKGHIMRQTYHKQEELDADINIINLKNGLYSVELGRLHKHTHKYLSMSQKDITYVKGAKSKYFGKFLSEVLYATDVRTAIDAMAYTFYRDYQEEVVFVLWGYGRNGKTVYTSLITRMHGRNHVSNVPLSQMLSNQFALSDLENKDANVDNELDSSTIRQTAQLKRLTGGSRQPIRVEQKNVKAHDTILHAKLFFNANKIPVSEDTSDAYMRRVIIIAFPNKFEGAKEDRHLLSKLTSPEEISGIFNVLMMALRRIRNNKEIYETTKAIEKKIAKYLITVDPTQSFLDEAISQDSLISDVTYKDKLNDAYVRFCKKHTISILNYDSLCRCIKNKGYTDGRDGAGPNRKYFWKGIKLVPEYLLELEQTTIG